MAALAVNRTSAGPEAMAIVAARLGGRFAREMMVTLDTGGVRVMQNMIEAYLLINTSYRIKQEGVRRLHHFSRRQRNAGSERKCCRRGPSTEQEQ